MEKEMAAYSNTLAWKIPWMEEPGRLQSMGSRRVGHDSVTSLSRIREGNGNPLQYSCLENPRDRGAWWAAINGVAQSRTWLKWLSSSSRRNRGAYARTRAKEKIDLETNFAARDNLERLSKFFIFPTLNHLCSVSRPTLHNILGIESGMYPKFFSFKNNLKATYRII